MKKYFIAFIALFSIALFVSGSTFVARAVNEAPVVVPVCSPEQMAYEKATALFKLDIRRTVDNFVTSVVISGFTSTNGVSPDHVMSCEGELAEYLNGIFGEKSPYYGEESFCELINEGDGEMCTELISDVENMSGYNGSNIASVKTRAVRSSLIGLGNMTEMYLKTEPLPVNLAYSFNRSLAKVPFFNKALAGPSGALYENLPVLKAAYDVWKFSRDAALGFVALVLLYTGIMIIMRKKVNSQLVVSVQYAIPKIVVGIFLIIFSYTIGALITSVSWGLFRGADNMVLRGFLPNAGISDGIIARELGSGSATLAIMTKMNRLAQGGSFYTMLIWFVSVILTVLKVVLMLKALIIYVKMVLAVLTAPFEMALGTIPGSESRIGDWFKRMAKYGVTVFAMGLIVPLTLILAISVTAAYSKGVTGAEMGNMGGVMAVLAPLVIVIFGFSTGISMDKKVEAAFEGIKKKR